MMYSSGAWASHSWMGTVPFLGLGALGAVTLSLIGILIIAVLILKGFALWYAARRHQKWWFLILLLVNTAGILELIYLLAVVKVLSKNNPSSL